MDHETATGWYGKLWKGQMSLAASFWLYGVLGIAIATLGMPFIIYALGLVGVREFLFVGILMVAAVTLYQSFVSVGVWRSSRKYIGPKVWPVLARIVVAFAAMWSCLGLWATLEMSQVDTHDPLRSSRNVTEHLNRSAAFPFTGFWKESCSQDFGFVIEPSPNEGGKYSVSFCGPGGCFKPGTYRADTTLVGDPSYRIIDVNTIEIKSGWPGSSRMVRCE